MNLIFSQCDPLFTLLSANLIHSLSVEGKIEGYHLRNDQSHGLIAIFGIVRFYLSIHNRVDNHIFGPEHSHECESNLLKISQGINELN